MRGIVTAMNFASGELCSVNCRQTTLLVGSNVIKVVPRLITLVFVLNGRLSAADHSKKLCQKVYWIYCSLRSHASHVPFEVARRLFVSLLMPHIGYGGIVYAGADAAS
jgi:hypothetical protein